jgi:hypothetical protein
MERMTIGLALSHHVVGSKGCIGKSDPILVWITLIACCTGPVKVPFPISPLPYWVGGQENSDFSCCALAISPSIDDRITKAEGGTRTLDNHEFRIANDEKQTSDAASAMRTVENTLNDLATDMRVTREILQRIEAAQARPASRASP